MQVLALTSCLKGNMDTVTKHKFENYSSESAQLWRHIDAFDKTRRIAWLQGHTVFVTTVWKYMLFMNIYQGKYKLQYKTIKEKCTFLVSENKIVNIIRKVCKQTLKRVVLWHFKPHENLWTEWYNSKIMWYYCTVQPQGTGLSSDV